MAIIKCIECGNDVSEYADKCPNCGCPVSIIKNNKNSNNYMAKLINGGQSKVKVIAEIRKITGYDLAKAKDIVDNCGIIKNNVSLEEGNRIKKQISDVGGTVELVLMNMISIQPTASAMQQSNQPKCPTCGSTNIEKISLTKKATGGLLFGIFSSDVRKQMHCKDCGYKW